jgi:hypothetical protein
MLTCSVTSLPIWPDSDIAFAMIALTTSYPECGKWKFLSPVFRARYGEDCEICRVDNPLWNDYEEVTRSDVLWRECNAANELVRIDGPTMTDIATQNQFAIRLQPPVSVALWVVRDEAYDFLVARPMQRHEYRGAIAYSQGTGAPYDYLDCGRDSLLHPASRRWLRSTLRRVKDGKPLVKALATTIHIANELCALRQSIMPSRPRTRHATTDDYLYFLKLLDLAADNA